MDEVRGEFQEMISIPYQVLFTGTRSEYYPF